MTEATPYKKFAVRAQQGIRGESFFESLICRCAIPHRIVGPTDIGLDYLCELVFGDRPTGVLFAAQVKTLASSSLSSFNSLGTNDLNGLEQYEINASSLKVDDATLQYWSGLGLPTYLFVVVTNDIVSAADLECYYRRYTCDLTTTEIVAADVEHSKPFFRVNKGGRFLSFADMERRRLGFVRDLFVDHVRWTYFKGQLAYLDPGKLGLNQFQPDKVFIDLFEDYRDQICKAYNWWKSILDNLCCEREI